jgi:hypothetical protein
MVHKPLAPLSKWFIYFGQAYLDVQRFSRRVTDAR